MKLDEKGFVFLDWHDKPYLCRMWGDSPWLFYWHPDGHWVSLRRVDQRDIFSFPDNLSREEQDIYHKKHDEHQRGRPTPKKEEENGRGST